MAATRTVGNAVLVSLEEEDVANLLRRENLGRVNENSAKVVPRRTFYTRIGKRLIDVIVSMVACVALLPVNLVLGVMTFFDVGRPIFFKQTRVGKDGKPFTLVKFRNMTNEKDANGRLLPPSERVTKFGAAMRKYSLDELLNFWSILKGDMSIIGPRPLPLVLHERLSDRHKQRSAVRPGLECPRVIHVDHEDDFKYARTFENDVWYAENVSLCLDLKMFALLVKMVFSMKKRGSQASGQGMSYFVGYAPDGTALSLNNYRRLKEEGRI